MYARYCKKIWLQLLPFRFKELEIGFRLGKNGEIHWCIRRKFQARNRRSKHQGCTFESAGYVFSLLRMKRAVIIFLLALSWECIQMCNIPYASRASYYQYRDLRGQKKDEHRRLSGCNKITITFIKEKDEMKRANVERFKYTPFLKEENECKIISMRSLDTTSVIVEILLFFNKQKIIADGN